MVYELHLKKPKAILKIILVQKKVYKNLSGKQSKYNVRTQILKPQELGWISKSLLTSSVIWSK